MKGGSYKGCHIRFSSTCTVTLIGNSVFACLIWFLNVDRVFDAEKTRQEKAALKHKSLSSWIFRSVLKRNSKAANELPPSSGRLTSLVRLTSTRGGRHERREGGHGLIEILKECHGALRPR